MKKLTIISILIVLTLAITAFMPPPLPSSFYGRVSANGRAVPAGLDVVGYVDGVRSDATKTFMYQGWSYYFFDVQQAGQVVTFTVGGFPARETAAWRSGTLVELNLSVGGNKTYGR